MTPTNIQENSQLITIKEASQILGKSIKTIRWYTQQGKLAKVMVGGQFGEEIRLKKSEVEALAGFKPLPKEEGYPSTANHGYANRYTKAIPDGVFSHSVEQKDFGIPEKGRGGDYQFLKTQLTEAKQHERELREEKERLWRDKEQMNTLVAMFQKRAINLEEERKLLTEGEQQLKERIIQENSIHLQEKEKIAKEYLSKIQWKNITLGVMLFYVALSLCFVGIITVLHSKGLVKIESPFLQNPDTTEETPKTTPRPRAEEGNSLPLNSLTNTPTNSLTNTSTNTPANSLTTPANTSSTALNPVLNANKTD